MNDYREKVTRYLKYYIETEKALRARPESWSSAPHRTPEFLRISEQHRIAERNLWGITDCEYSDDGFRNFIWEWRYWSVMSRKCCHYQLTTGKTAWAIETMAKLHEAEYNFAKACGLVDLYESPCEALHKQFPKLCSRQPENTTTTTDGSWWTAVRNCLCITGK